VARQLQAPLDVLLVRKLGSPGQPELGLGAVVEAEPPLCLLDDDIAAAVGATPAYIEAERQAQCALLAERQRLYRGARPLPDVADRVVVLVDDGIATGVTLRAALRGLSARGAARVVVGVPVAPVGIAAVLGLAAADVVCVLALAQLHAVGASYGDFSQTSDAEVLDLLQAWQP
jgi:putative phosphoribosyl transferase